MMKRLLLSLCVVLALVLTAFSMASAGPVTLLAKTSHGQSIEQQPILVNGRWTKVWNCDEKTEALIFKPFGSVAIPPTGIFYLKITYVDQGYGKLSVQLIGKDGTRVQPDRFLGRTRSDSKKLVDAQMRMPRIQTGGNGEISVRIGLEQPKGQVLCIEQVTLQDKPFNDPQFAYVISDPWKGPYVGPSVKPSDNSTLKGKVMVGYQGWFRTPNDPEGNGWIHWGDIQNKYFTTDMWPDISQYPVECLEKAADVKLKSGKQGYLFSSAWPGVVNTHFRWMREHDIDGAFVQRFVSDNFNSIRGGPEWVLANVRAAANREGRIWAVEYDVSGYPDAKILETLKTDWMWFVDTFGVREDPCYAREGGKPVVFIWGLPFPDRNFTVQTSNAVVDFFKSDPKYGGNYVIGGIPWNWRTMDSPWREHFKKYDCILPWMSQEYAADLADFKNLGISYYAHVNPGFSWANLKHLPSGDSTVDYVPRDAGRYYWKALSKAAQAHVDRVFVGMFDEYDEGTAIMPMSDDAPPTPVRPGVAATFYNGNGPQEQGDFVILPSTEIVLGDTAPSKRTSADNFFVRMGGQIVFPSTGQYTLFLEGAPGDDAELRVKGEKILDVKEMDGMVKATTSITASMGEAVSYRLDYRHGTGKGKLRLLWVKPFYPRQPVPVPPSALQDAWGRFITNDGKPSDWWLKLTNYGKGMMNGKQPADSAMP